ncbi:hypothetical protein Leryth_013157, partial [Lithospermum erythrorhizon]
MEVCEVQVVHKCCKAFQEKKKERGKWGWFVDSYLLSTLSFTVRIHRWLKCGCASAKPRGWAFYIAK